MYTISKQFQFCAAHHLPHLPEGHKCKRPHGHNYQVEILLRRSALDERGFVVDYAEMAPFKDYLDEHLDHRDLNEVLTGPTTAEYLAKHLYGVAWTLWHDVAITVRVSETPTTWAEYTTV